MMVTFISQCEKHALKRTRRVLDAFANRIGDNTWQTLITQEGLHTVQKLLRRSASRNTAVSCHWIRSRSRSQLLWVVGRKNKFNEQGYVPVNRTEKSLLGSEQGNDWKYLPLINGFVRLAALLHDWGKASQLFQDKLNPASNMRFKGDPLRHEWVSSLLFSALVKSQKEPNSDENWLDALITSSWHEQQLQSWMKGKNQLEKPLNQLPDAASLLVWLIVSHHRLPFLANKTERLQYADQPCNSLAQLLDIVDKQWGYQNLYDASEYAQRIQQCFEFPHGLLSESKVWRQALSQAAEHLKHQLPLFDEALSNGCWRLVAEQARLCLMLGDHNYSSKEADPTWQSNMALYANTQRVNGQTAYKQRLDEHLVNVANIAANITEYLPFFVIEPPVASDINLLKQHKNASGQFSWQEDVVNTIEQYREQQQDKTEGYFVVNMASTGCGKTVANAKIMQALSEDKQSLRFILALGLRALTLQTGDEYRTRLGIKDDNLAVLIGSKAVLDLHQEDKQKTIQQELQLAEFGSESQDRLFDDEGLELNWSEEKWQGSLPEEELATVLTRPKDRALLYAPILACTIDHIMGATETLRGGRYILPYLRLMSSDLVIDEIDDFTGNDPVAIGRLVYLAGALGRKVMISSATIPPTLAVFYFNAYQQGWHIHALSHQKSLKVGCVWVDEGQYDEKKDKCIHACQIATITTADDELTVSHYRQYHNNFIEKRVKALRALVARRKAFILPIQKEQGKDLQTQYFAHIQQAILRLHQAHAYSERETQLQVSFGVVRVANIPVCVALTHYLLAAQWPEEVEIRTMAYHSQQVLLLRHEQEKHLDGVLKRKEKEGEQPEAFQNPIVRQHLDQAHRNGKAKHLIFILVATPVEEVGRDHDFDWAVIEPSSYRSIVQMAGRVRRHRAGEVASPNIALLQYNWVAFQGNNQRDAFSKPGYENRNLNLSLSTYNLSELVDESQLLKSVDAIPRIQPITGWKTQQTTNLACLEHASIERLMGDVSTAKPAKAAVRTRSTFLSSAVLPKNRPTTLWGYTSGGWWMTALPQQFASFRESEPTKRVSLILSAKNRLHFCEYDKDSGWVTKEDEYGIGFQPLAEPLKQRLWLIRDYQQSLASRENEYQQAEQLSKRYGEISFLPRKSSGVFYHYNDQMGLSTFKVFE
ncbi:type I-F CRISPR-associated helicase Cas3f [Providencia huaxiensis]|uniref:type I-F CRISPR-associated helicase Cas3f n=1 Tax=Providencia TaxID=586 RepID=UPI000EBC6F5E|nr:MULTISPECIES: type I-F CRISPR-associated helicase Cas3f [Providencia]HCI95526.1 type I-F CRISPR-associated helicase Cas3 [Providencia sp.]EJD6042701.1 type I-F CRISPR-associated helicase Cas3 [Providencia rettgeri]ELR5057919.1 type I-F CRISPR-associated helicase Cas3 [Providencia rettgeri]ELR5085379.1 type I-F CRISPR-associated helicase Cas3 [Providencia rettgeri]ELR5108529.1 type I-F CRISPR-associated helicase Cas3 [Providencia rettgeri]